MEQRKENSTEEKLAFDKYNYRIMLGGLAVLMLGFVIMTMDKEPFGFGFLGLTLGPVLVFLAFIIEIFAILYRRK